MLELLLLLSTLLLAVQLGWPTLRHWWLLPGPGQIGFDRYSAPSLAREFLVQLPADYHGHDRWPLVVFLHGSGQRGTNPGRLRDQGPFRHQLAAIVVAPQCLPAESWHPDVVADFTRYCAARYPVDASRIYLVGFSMGGYGTWQTAAAYPELFAVIVPIAGGGNPAEAKSLIGLPIWAFHGDRDDTVPLLQSQQMIDAVRAAGGAPQLTVLPGAGHGICREVCALTDLWEWLFAQHRPSP